MNRILKANILAGVLPGVLLPVFFPITDFFIEGIWPDWRAYSGAAPSIAIGGVIFGVFLVGTLGSLVLMLLENVNLNRPYIGGTIGVVLGALISLQFLTDSIFTSHFSDAPIIVMFSLAGFLCGFVASKLSLTNKPSKQHAVNGASS